ncbi:Trimeric GatFAB AmidoTransferase(AdT) complex subunit, partial [Spiromyces aspiralis]
TYEGYYLKAQKIRRLVQHDFDRIFALPNPLSADPGLVADRETLVKRDGRVDILLAPTATSGPPQIPVSSPSSKCQSNSGQQAADENPAGAYVND